MVAITGTKGKSTTTALMTFFLQCLGEPALRLGNFGQPPYDPDLDVSHGWLVLEVSSFQCVDIDVAPGLVVVTSLGEDHLDWHVHARGLSPRQTLAHARDRRNTAPSSPTTRRCANWPTEIGGDVTFVAPDATNLAASLGLLGAHSNGNVALALESAAELTNRSVEEVRSRVMDSASEFEPLRGRLTLVATEDVGRRRRGVTSMMVSPLRRCR